jgi:hypothetical protein
MTWRGRALVCERCGCGPGPGKDEEEEEEEEEEVEDEIHAVENAEEKGLQKKEVEEDGDAAGVGAHDTCAAEVWVVVCEPDAARSLRESVGAAECEVGGASLRFWPTMPC